MANIYDLTNQAIEDSFQPLLQIDSGSGLRDGSGSLKDNINVTSSYALTASFAENVVPQETGSLLTTASFDNTDRNLTFTKGDSSTFSVNIPGQSGSVNWTDITNKPSGLVSESSQLTASYDERYTLSGSVQPLPSGLVSSSVQIDVTQTTNYSSINQYSDTKVKDKLNLDNVLSGSLVNQLPSGVVSGSSQISYPELSNIPSGIVSSSEQIFISASQVSFNSSSTELSSSNVQDAIKELDMTKAPISALSSNIIIYPTTATSSIAGYSRLVTSPDEEGYNTTAVNIPTGMISGSNQFIAALATTGSLFQGNPGVINITTLGNVRRVGGGAFSSADFYFEIYKRSGSVETLIGTSNHTAEVNEDSYEEFFASALLNNGNFTQDDIIVTKYYGNLLSGFGGDPSFEFQFGGEEPIRTLIPVPASVITDPTLTLRVDNLELFSGSINNYTSSNDSKVQSLIDATGSYATTGSNTFNGIQTIQSSDGDLSPVIIEGGPDFVTKFTASKVKANIFEGSYLSGSWGVFGFNVGGVGNTSPVIYNANTGSTTQAAIRLQHSPNPSIQTAYNSWASFPPTLPNNPGIVDIKGTIIRLQATTSSLNTSVLVDGSVSASSFTGSVSGAVEGTFTGSILNPYLESNTFANPQTITDNVNILTGQTGIIIGETSIAGDYTIEGNSELYVFTPPPTIDTNNNALLTGNNTFTGNQVISGSFGLNSPDKPIIIQAKNTEPSSGSILIDATNLVLQSTNPTVFNSRITINGAFLLNAALYQSQPEQLSGPSQEISNTYDYFDINLNNNDVKLNLDTMFGQSRTIYLKVRQGSPSTGSLQLVNETGATKILYGQSGSILSNGYLNVSQITSSLDYFELKAFGDTITVSNYIKNLEQSTITTI